MRLGILILLVAFSSATMCAQKDAKANDRKTVAKAISTAKANIKKGAALAEAEASMRDLLKDSDNLDNEKIWLTLFDAVKKQYEQLNEKLYLKQQSDTAKFFTHTLHMFDVLESLDSVNSVQDKSGKSVPSYRKKYSTFLAPYRANLYSAGGYYVQKQDYGNAYLYFKSYIDCARQPMFEEYDYTNTDELMPEAAYWALFCGYKLGNTKIIDENTALASKNDKRDVFLQQYLAEACLMKKDTAGYRDILEKAFDKYPGNPYFFPHLAVYYANMGMDDKVLEISQRMLSLNSDNVPALIARSSALLNKERYDECLTLCDKAIALDSTQSVAYLNAGLAYYNQSVPLSSKKRQTKTEKAKIIDLYKRALPYLAKYRQMQPDDKAMWLSPLYNIYLNLNMGDEFEEIDRIINQ